MDTVLKSRVAEIIRRIEDACGRAGREPSGVRLMAVTKNHSWENVLEAYDAGLRIFGENRVAEATEKYAASPPGLELHLIGHLQSNKAKDAAGLFSWVDSIDSLRTARALDKRLEPLGKTADILLELNTSGEESKSGYESFAAMEKELEAIRALPRLRLRGLMTIGPLTEDSGRIRDAFRFLRVCMDRLRLAAPSCKIDTLSMGMSGDFEIAVEEGSNLVRLGTILFGKRVS